MQKLTEKKVDACFIAFLVLYLVALMISIVWNHIAGWDESVYIGMGKYLFSLGKVGGWEIMRPILLPMVVGFLWKLGFDALYAAKVIGPLFSLSSIILVYLIGKRLFGRLAGLLAAVFLAVTPVFFYNSAYGLTDIPSTFFALVAIYLLLRKSHLFFVGLSAALAFLFRFPQGIFFIAVILSIFLLSINRPKLMIRQATSCALGFVAALIPFLVFNYFMYHNDVSPLVAAFRPILFAIHEQSTPFYQNSFAYYPIALFKENPFIIFSVAGLLFIIKRRNYNLPKLVLLISLTLFLLYFSLIPSKVLRFSLSFLPYLSLIAGFGFIKVVSYLKRWRSVLLLFLLACSLVILTCAGSYLINNPNMKYSADYSTLEFYNYFNEHKISGKVLTTVPQPLAYSNNKFEMVFYPAKIKRDYSAAMFVPHIFLCPENDIGCEDDRDNLFSQIRSGKLVFSKEYQGGLFEIYTYEH